MMLKLQKGKGQCNVKWQKGKGQCTVKWQCNIMDDNV